ncbi:hypothetical protein J31TS4_34330 [Paenibacillus sp. J31TS4]|nr:hypothetical protein J31TS4_34330 [Paenibacillus sp. J31TS4]
MLFAIRATIPTATMRRNAILQPKCCPTNVPSGTPVTVATVRPENMMEIALALRSSGTKSAAIVEPIDINRPWERAEMTRAASSTPILEALAAKLLPAINTIMIESNNVFRDTVDVSDVKTGAPKVTPSAYRETVRPAVVTGTCKSPAINGNNPTLINSVVPMANALTARARSANVLRFLSIDMLPSCNDVNLDEEP